MQSALLLDSTFPDFFPFIHICKEGLCAGQLPVCSSSALFLYLWSALPLKVLVEGWEGRRQKRAFLGFLWHALYGEDQALSSALECDPDSGGLSSYLLPLLL